MKIDTTPFERAHGGSKPYGNRRWVFCPADRYGRADYLFYVYRHTGPFSIAKRAAARHFGERGVERVVVCK
jgi:hypothetical protein